MTEKFTNTLCLKGSIKWLNNDKGFGFAVPDGLAIDVIFDLSAFPFDAAEKLRQEQRVYMEITRQATGGYSATHIILLD